MATTIKRKTRKSAPRIKPDDGKFRELILLIARESEGDPRFGSIKLNKLLFYADFVAYQHLGKPITGQEYFALPQGPAPRYMVPIREKMEADGDIAIRQRETWTDVQDRTFALREPDLKKFTAEEVDLVHAIIHGCRGLSGKYLSELTHRFAGWKLANEKETIPYSVALIHRRTPTQTEIERARSLEGPAASCLAKYANVET